MVRELLDRIPDDPETLRARVALVNTLSGFALTSGDVEEHTHRSWQVLALAELTGDPRLIATGWNSVAIATVGTLPLTARMLFQHTIELAGEHRALRPRALALLNLTATIGLEDLSAAIAYGRDAIAASTELGEPAVLTFSQSNLAYALQLTGGWDEALELVRLEDVRRFVVVTPDIIERTIGRARGEDVPAAEDVFGQDAEVLEEPAMLAEYTLDRALDAAGDRLDEAAEIALDGVRQLSAATTAVLDFWPGWLTASEIISRQRSPDALTELLEYVDNHKGPCPAGITAQRIRLEAVLGELGSMTAPEIEHKYTEAVGLMRAWGATTLEAHTCADYGTWLERQGRADEAADQLGRAQEVYHQLGASRWLEALESRTTPTG